MIRSNMTNKEALEKWEAYRKSVERSTPVPTGETEKEKRARIERLKKDFPAFCKYYFPQYITSDFAPFHLRFAKKVASMEKIYIVRAWARAHAKSVVAGLFVPLFEMVNDRLDNMLLVSHSYDNACELLMPIMVQLEANHRFIHDFGQQKSWRGWEIGKFVTANAKSFRALGSGQSPRGSRNEEKRPDFILIDDIDTDEEARNPLRLKRKWDWCEQALRGTFDTVGRQRYIVIGNIIAKDGIVVRASKMADDFEQINILDKNGKPSWPAKNTLPDVNYLLSKISYASGQKEYFNNPISEGTVFKDMRYGKVPPLSKLRHVVIYCDASYKSSKKGDFKAVVLVGEYNGDYYIIKARLEQTTLNVMLKWFYDLYRYASAQTQVYMLVECNGFQDAWYQDVFMPALRNMEKTEGTLAIAPDDRDKPDKFSRIEGNLEPLNRRGSLILNEAEKDNPHMTRLEEQFLAIEPNSSAHDDGPDAVEGAVWIINTKLRNLAPMKVNVQKRTKNKY